MEFNKSKIEELFHKKWKLIGIVYYGRSGSFFLQSILDGHPQILALPPHINNMYNVTYDSKRNFYRDTFVSSSVGEIFNPIISGLLWNLYENPVASGPSKFYGENKNIIFCYKHDDFIKIFKKIIDIAAHRSHLISRKNIYLSLFIAYNLMIGKDIDTLLDAKYLMTQVHTPIFNELQEIKKDFDDFIYLVSVREPVSGLVSHIQAYNDMLKVNYFSEGSYNHCVPIALREVLNGAVVPSFLGKDQCRAVKNEYLHIYQNEYAKCLLDYLGLPWNDTCNKSTIDGEIFWWKFGDKYKTGYNKGYKWRICDKLNASCSDKKFFSALLKDRYDAWGYQGCPGATLNIGKKIKERFDFFEQLCLSAYIRDAYLRIILHYYENSYKANKEYIPVLKFTPQDGKQSFTCNLATENASNKFKV